MSFRKRGDALLSHLRRGSFQGGRIASVLRLELTARAGSQLWGDCERYNMCATVAFLLLPHLGTDKTSQLRAACP